MQSNLNVRIALREQLWSFLVLYTFCSWFRCLPSAILLFSFLCVFHVFLRYHVRVSVCRLRCVNLFVCVCRYTGAGSEIVSHRREWAPWSAFNQTSQHAVATLCLPATWRREPHSCLSLHLSIFSSPHPFFLLLNSLVLSTFPINLEFLFF